MPKFFYVVRDNSGKRITGYEDASSSDELVSRLQGRGLLVTNITPALDSKLAVKDYSGPKRHKHYRVTSSDLVLFCRQLATLLSAGVTILKSLDIISKQVSSFKFFRVIESLGKDMESGLSFHDAMAKHPGVFSELWVNLAESGEASGNLAVILSRLASYLERKEAFKRKLISALVYPLMLLFTGMGALFFLTIKIIPTFAELFKGFNVKLPLLTQMLITLSVFLRKYILIIFGIGVAVFLLFRNYIKTKEGRKKFEQFQFNLPTFGEFMRALVVERFSSGISTLIESGVPLLYSLEIAEHSVDNLVMGDIIHQIKEDVREGKFLSQPMAKSGFFEPMVVQMVAVGEEIGDLPQMFKRINEFYQEYVETFLTRFISMFEPVMLIFMGLIIGTIVLGLFLPIFQIANIGAG